MFKRIKYFNTLAVFIASTSILTLFSPLTVHGAPVGTSLAPSAKISFTFDDSLASTYTNAAPILKQNGLVGTDYAISGCVGMTNTPNSCLANKYTPYMTWAQLSDLQNSFGWEIGSHTVDHKCLASSAKQDPSDCQGAQLTQAQVDQELANSKTTLASHGINATDFAPPYGDYSNMVLQEIAKYYASMRGFKDQNNNIWPYDDYLLNDFPVLEGTDPVSTVEAKIAQAEANNQWLILTFHNILPSPSTNPDDYEYSTSEFAQIAAFVKSEQSAGKINNVTVNQGLVSSPNNMLPNGNFQAGISGGWTTDAPANVVANSGGFGSYPNQTYSVKLTSTTKNVHLFSPKVSVDPYSVYIFKNYLNLVQAKGGLVGYYIDEYDFNGNWISGQWQKSESNPFVEDMNFSYKPSSAKVSKIDLQMVVSGVSGTIGYVANAQMFPSTLGVTPSNLVPNGTFDAGISGGWTTDDPADIIADSANHGSPADPGYSIALNSATTAKNGQLYSPKVKVAYGSKYSLTNWLNVLQLNTAANGEVGYYVDEYDASGNWISGQYLGGVRNVGTGNVGFNYSPSSASVANASLQVIVVGQANIQAYIDDVVWSLN